jgi:hypothetical protein
MNPILTRWLWVVAITITLIVALAPAPQVSTRARAAGDDSWLVPRLSTQDLQPFAATLAKSGLWGASAEQSSGEIDRASQWRLAAIVGQGRDRAAVVEFGDARVVAIKVGQKFPDGTPIVDIKENGVCVRMSNGKRFLPLASQTVPIVW